MRTNFSALHIALFFLVLLVLFDCLYVVNQVQHGVLFQFGEAIKIHKDPGLKFKIPFIQKVEYFDKRILNVEAEAKELTASDGKRVIVDAFARFQITDPVKFYKTVHDYYGFRLRLNKILEASMRKVIGRVSLSSLLTKARNDAMAEIKSLVNEESDLFGVVVIDVRILRADLPKENGAAIYQRMQTDREKEAKQIRAEGSEESAKIKSIADKESQIIIAKAFAESEAIKAEGDGVASKIYNEAYSKDPEFYNFYRSLDAYQHIIKSEDTRLILSSQSELFKYLNIGK